MGTETSKRPCFIVILGFTQGIAKPINEHAKRASEELTKRINFISETLGYLKVCSIYIT